MDADQMNALVTQIANGLAQLSTTHSAPKDLPHFDGKDYESWVDLYEALVDKEADRIKFLPIALKGRAQTWFSNIKKTKVNNDAPQTWNDWKGLFTETYKRDVGTLMAELRGRKLNASESILDYVQDVENLCNLIDSTWSNAVKVNHLMNGIPGQLHLNMSIQKPTTPMEFITAYKTIETSNSAKQSTDKEVISALLELVKKKSEPETAPQLYAQAQLTREYRSTASDREVTQRLFNIETDLRTIMNELNIRHRVDSDFRQQQTNRQLRQSMFCDYCERSGHLEHECRVKKRNERQRNQEDEYQHY